MWDWAARIAALLSSAMKMGPVMGVQTVRSSSSPRIIPTSSNLYTVCSSDVPKYARLVFWVLLPGPLVCMIAAAPTPLSMSEPSV